MSGRKLFRTAVALDETTKPWLRFCALLLVSWFVMTFTHECGHVIGGWLSGATLIDVEILPWQLPYSLHNPDPRPLITLWAGPLLGALLPFSVAILLRRPSMNFIADFCLLANGAYIGVASFSSDRFLDTNRLLEAGASPLSIAIYCVITIGWGYHHFRRDCIEVLSPAPKRAKDCDETN